MIVDCVECMPFKISLAYVSAMSLPASHQTPALAGQTPYIIGREGE